MKREMFVFAALAVLCLFAAPLAGAQKVAAPTAASVVESLYKRTPELQKYKLLFDYLVPKTEKIKGESRTCEYWYAGPDFIRLAVLDGDDKGSIVAYNAKKNKRGVKAKQPFLPVAISVGKDDPRLEGFFRSDWNSDIGDVKKFTASAKPKLLGEDKLKGRPAYKIEFTGLKGEFDKIILWIDKKDSVLVQYEYYAGGAMKQRKTWYNYDLNPTLADADFKP